MRKERGRKEKRRGDRIHHQRQTVSSHKIRCLRSQDSWHETLTREAALHSILLPGTDSMIVFPILSTLFLSWHWSSGQILDVIKDYALHGYDHDHGHVKSLSQFLVLRLRDGRSDEILPWQVTPQRVTSNIPGRRSAGLRPPLSRCHSVVPQHIMPDLHRIELLRPSAPHLPQY
jgi:hypothetical protein